MDMVRDMKKTASRRSFYALFCLRARDGAFRAPARVTFFCCQKKVTKENHLDLRFKDPLARGGFRRPGGEQVLRLRAQATFFPCRKKVAKERHLRKGGFRISPFP